MRNNQCIRIIRSLEHGIVNKGDSDKYSIAVQYENKLIHEHDFIRVGAKETNSSLVHCINCGEYYCDLCGKAL
jgi:hypothetical protein